SRRRALSRRARAQRTPKTLRRRRQFVRRDVLALSERPETRLTTRTLPSTIAGTRPSRRRPGGHAWRSTCDEPLSTAAGGLRNDGSHRPPRAGRDPAVVGRRSVLGHSRLLRVGAG